MIFLNFNFVRRVFVLLIIYIHCKNVNHLLKICFRNDRKLTGNNNIISVVKL